MLRGGGTCGYTGVLFSKYLLLIVTRTIFIGEKKKKVKGQILHVDFLSRYSGKSPAARRFHTEHCWWQERARMVPSPEMSTVCTRSTSGHTGSLAPASPSHPTPQPQPRLIGRHGQVTLHQAQCQHAPPSVLHTWKTPPDDGERKGFLLVPLDDTQAWRQMLSSPSRGTALSCHFGCCTLLHFQAMDDILWEISNIKSTKRITKHITVCG